MRTVSLAPTSLSTTRVGFGCGGLMRSPSHQERQRLLACVFDLGVRHFDAARMYGLGAAERELGQFLRNHRRDAVTVATKFGIAVPGGSAALGRVQAPLRAVLSRFPRLRALVKRRAEGAYEARQYDVASARESLHTSLRELGTDYVDILFVHGPQTIGQVPFEELGAFLEGARDAGKLRAWGVAGAQDPSRLVAERLPAPAVAQLSYDVFGEPVSDAAIVFGVLTEAVPRLAGQIDPSELSPLLLQEALASHPNAVVLFGSSSIEHATANVQAAELAEAEATHEQLERLRTLARGI